MKTRITSKVENSERDCTRLILSTRKTVARKQNCSTPNGGCANDPTPDTETDSIDKTKLEHDTSINRRSVLDLEEGKLVESDVFCWICHCDGPGISCELCPRFYHVKCLVKAPPSSQWICTECQNIMSAEAVESKSKVLQLISIDTLSVLLRYVLQRMKLPETLPFHHPVDCTSLPTYADFVFHPMDFTTIDKNIKKQIYGSTEAFIADVKWILHNCIIFNGKNHPLTSVAKSMFKICCHEANELHICPDCYLNSCIKENDDWFCEPCRKPHVLVWAKMKGYPFWPAKVLREENSQVDVRFFGEHDRAWVPLGHVFLLSENPPGAVPKKTKGFDIAKDELKRHLELLREKFCNFSYAPDKTLYVSSPESKHEYLREPSSNIFPKISNKLLLKRKLPQAQPNNFTSGKIRRTMRAYDAKENIRSSRKKMVQRKDEDRNDEKGNEDSKKIVLKINKLHLIHKSIPDESIQDNKFEDCSDVPSREEDVEPNETTGNCGCFEVEKDCENGEKKKDSKCNGDLNAVEIGNIEFSDEKASQSLLSCGKTCNQNSTDANQFSDKSTLKECSTLTTEAKAAEKPLLNESKANLSDISSNSQNIQDVPLFVSSREIHCDQPCDRESDIFKLSKISVNVCDNDTNMDVDKCMDEVNQERQEAEMDIRNTSGSTSENDAEDQLASSSPVTSHCTSLDNFNDHNKGDGSISKKGIRYLPSFTKMVSSVQNLISQFVEDTLNETQSRKILQNIFDEELRNIKQLYKDELAAIKHSSEVQIAEMRLLFQYEKNKFERQKLEEFENLKSKLWCANCLKEATYNCCWRANYCSVQCQEDHWHKHADLCARSLEAGDFILTDYSLTKAANSHKKNPVIKTLQPIHMKEPNRLQQRPVTIQQKIVSIPQHFSNHQIASFGSQSRLLESASDSVITSLKPQLNPLQQ